MNVHLESELAKLRREQLQREAENERRAKSLLDEAKKLFSRENV